MTMTEGPNYFRDAFPYTAPPRIAFANEWPDLALAPVARPVITDTTFRDGQQARIPYRPFEIRDLFDLLHRLGGEAGLIRQTEFFLYSDDDRRAVAICQDRGYRFPEVTSWIRARKEDFSRVRAAGVAETGILTSVSDYHIFKKLGLDRQRAADMYLGIVKEALAAGIRPRCHFEDVTRADIRGFVIPFARSLVALGEEAGLPVRIRLCDTMGFGIFHAAAELPRGVPRLVRALIEDAGVPGEQLEWHGHNDFHLGVANAMAAWLSGCAAVNGTLLGFGERTGNVPIEAMVVAWAGLTGRDDVDLSAISAVADYFQQHLGYQIPPMTPFAGEKMNVTAAGIHADGLMKDEEIYNIFDTAAILNRPPGVMVTDKAGLAGVAFWLNRRRAIDGRTPLSKDDPQVRRLHAFVEHAYRKGRTTALADEELAAALACIAADGQA